MLQDSKNADICPFDFDSFPLRISCGDCVPATDHCQNDFERPRPTTSPFSPFSPKERWTPLGEKLGHGARRGAGEGCESCQIRLPEVVSPPTAHQKPEGWRGLHPDTPAPPLRTVERIHVCNGDRLHAGEIGDDDIADIVAGQDGPQHPSLSFSSSESGASTPDCHTHSIEYVSNSTPAESSTYSGLRRAVIRTLSGEQLPRGHSSGPLYFGDLSSGYTIAYIFRLADPLARGRQRYYALLALAGTDAARAFEASTIVWTFFETLARNIIETAENIAAQSSPSDDSPIEFPYITPISSFLTGRNVGDSGDLYSRRGGAMGAVRARSIADLVNNKNFFCELHMAFVGMLQDLGRSLGGVRIEAPLPGTATTSNDIPSKVSFDTHHPASEISEITQSEPVLPFGDMNENGEKGETDHRDSTSFEETVKRNSNRNSGGSRPSSAAATEAGRVISRTSTPLCNNNPSGGANLVSQARVVAV
ncbi:hypothetical protein MMC25_002336 [Agyrium rufum]|nr:hypothetical protein [Agyrium rufum]